MRNAEKNQQNHQTYKKFNMININSLNEKDNNLLSIFFEKRRLFDVFIEKNKLNQFTCPGCGYPTLTERGGYEICSVCNWEDDNQDDNEANEIFGGPNGKLSLTENRIIIGRIINGKKDLTLNNFDLEKDIQLIKEFESKLTKIEKRMSGNENLQHPIWEEWKKVEKDLQIELSKIND